ncbi:MAG: CHASE2 domain-containing protein, partial [Paracoccaceae bacterium]
MKLKRQVDWIALALGAVTLGVVMTFVSIFSVNDVREIEETVFDQYQRWKPREYDPSIPVRVIDIDEESLERLGQWPWPRFYLAEMVRRITNAGAATIAFDVVFAEPDRTSPALMASSYRRFGDEYAFAAEGLESLGGDDGMPDHDEIFSWMISQTPVVLGTIPTDAPQSDLVPPRPVGMAVSGDGGDLTEVIEWYEGATVNLPQLSEGALGVGAISLSKDDRGIVRRVPLALTIGNNQHPFPALAIEALRVAQGAPSFIVKTSRGAGETDFSEQVDIVSIKVGNAVVPLDGDGALRVRYSGAMTERVIPAWKLLEPGGLSEEVAAEVAGMILFVGSSAATLFDIRRTPLHDRISGVHVHAEIVEQIWQDRYLERPDWSVAVERVIMVVCGLIVLFFVGNTMPLLGFIALAVSLVGICAGSWFAFTEANLLISPVAPLAGVVLPHFVVSGYKYFTSEANRREVTRQFEHFVAPEVIQDILDNPDEHLTPGGALRTLSIMFLDVRRFSTITEKMEPQQVISFINELLTPLTDAILENEGTIDKYMGDAVMAFWNAPRNTP